MTKLSDITDVINAFRSSRLSSPCTIRIKGTVLRQLEEAHRALALERAMKDDAMMAELNGPPEFEARVRREQKAQPFATTGDLLFGLRIEIDEKIAEDFRIE